MTDKKVLDMARTHRNKMVIWRDQLNGEIHSNTGFKLVQKVNENGEKQLRLYGLNLIDPNGNCVGEIIDRWSLRSAPFNQYFTYKERYGRSGETDGDIKFGPHHFPRGTVFEVDQMVGEQDFDNLGSTPYGQRKVRFTVDDLYFQDVKNFVITTKELAPKFRDEERRPHRYTFEHVRRIISYGTEGMKFSGEDRPEWKFDKCMERARAHTKELNFEKGVKLKKGEIVLDSKVDHYLDVIYMLIEDMGLQLYGRHLDPHKVIHNASWCRLVNVVQETAIKVDEEEWTEVETTSVFVWNFSKIRKDLQKKLHRFLNKVSVDRKQAEAADRAMATEMSIW